MTVSIEELLEDYKQGKMIILMDDEGRENEGDLLIAAEKVTKEDINFMATHGRGLICAPISEEHCDKLGLEMMVSNNSAAYETPFTVSIDLIGHGCTTGISASDRAKTVLAMIDPATRPEELGKPGHIFPLRAKKGGVLRRAGHTEAAVDLSRLSGFEEAGIIVEILNEDGSMARLPQLIEIAQKFNLKIISIEELIKYRIAHESLVEKVVNVFLPTDFGDFQLHAFKDKSNDMDHLALVKGTWEIDEPILIRVHSSCLTGDIFGSCRCDCGPQLMQAISEIEERGSGLVVYLRDHEGRGIGLSEKIRAYALQDLGQNTLEANISLGHGVDERSYGDAIEIFRALGITNVELLTNNPDKLAAFEGSGINYKGRKLQVVANEFNRKYLETKRDLLSHSLGEI